MAGSVEGWRSAHSKAARDSLMSPDVLAAKRMLATENENDCVAARSVCYARLMNPNEGETGLELHVRGAHFFHSAGRAYTRSKSLLRTSVPQQYLAYF